MTVTVQITPPQLKYLQFLQAHKISKDEPVFITQSKAAQRFGRGNVERWHEKGKIQAYYRGVNKDGRPIAIEYKMAELLAAAETVQDYDINWNAV